MRLLTAVSLVRVQQGELFSKEETGEKRIRLRGQAVKTSPFHGGNTGSIPVGVIFSCIICRETAYVNSVWRSSQVVRHRSATPRFTGSNPVCAFCRRASNPYKQLGLEPFYFCRSLYKNIRMTDDSGKNMRCRRLNPKI